MRNLFSTLLSLLILSNCSSKGQETLNKEGNSVTAVIFTPLKFYDSLSIATLSIVNTNIIYTPDWVNIDYPMGDVPVMTGFCSDEIIRAYRKMGSDLQKELQEDILKYTNRYPNITNPDHNIDHRRDPNLSTFLQKMERF